ncbi:MAG: hypothetical protein RQ751_00095 [Longimicrobiales bacterium]|nr:hypothetical protein [Longimicrobiales bacterium]
MTAFHPVSSICRPATLRRLLPALAVLAGAAVGRPGPLIGQEPAAEQPTTADALRVFLDCQTFNCRADRFRQEITWVVWVREPQDAQVHILMTGQSAGSGGFQYSLDFQGRGALAEARDRFRFTSSATDVEEEVVAGLRRVLSLGLVRYAALAGLGGTVEVTGVPAADRTGGEREVAPEDDPWNFWVFSIRADAEIEREDRETQDEFGLDVTANRTTDLWKLDVRGSLDIFRREVNFEDGGGFVDERNDWETSLLLVRSLSPHWSVGFLTAAGSSTRFNRDFAVEFAPAVEWNFFPWQESTRRRFVVLYTLGVDYLDYEEVTVFQKMEETLLAQRLDVQVRVQEPWGSARVGAEGRHLLQHSDQFRVELSGRLDYRLVRGLSLSLGANYEVIRDQRFLSGAGLSPEEILTSRRALATGSRTSFEVGLSYRFGSIFNNIVNARFPGLNTSF